MEIYFAVGVYLFLCGYILVFCLFFWKEDKKRRCIHLFHNAVLSVYKRNASRNPYRFKDITEQLTLNYNKIFQSEKESNRIMLLDMIDQMIFYYDSYSDTRFKKMLHAEKENGVRQFLFAVSSHMKGNDPFASLPAQEATLLKNISDAIYSNNTELGKTAIEQLSTEILNKEALIRKQERNNQITTMMSIVGTVLTVFFGIASLF